MSEILPVSVVIPTVGRPKLLSACLESVARCNPRPAEIIVVDQSHEDAVVEVVRRFSPNGARLAELDVRNKSLALNRGLREVRHEIALVTDDDCTVAESWVGAAFTHMAADPGLMVTGRVLAEGEPLAVPSTIAQSTPYDYTGELQYGALFGGNMACNRTLVLELGGFDARFEAAEDNDLCYRWLRAGRRLRYEPDLIVWHHSWRTPGDMSRVYLAYGRGQGTFYAKHLRGGDLRVLPFLTRDLYRGVRGVAALALRGRGAWPDPRIGLLRGMIRGLVTGWSTRTRPTPPEQTK